MDQKLQFEFYERIFHAMEEGVMIQDHLGRFVQFNVNAARVFGLSEEHLLGNLVWESESNLMSRIMEAGGRILKFAELPTSIVIKSGVPQRNTLLGVPSEDGSTNWVRLSAVPVFDSEKRVVSHVVSTFRDVTSELEYEKKESERQARLKQVEESLQKQKMLASHNAKLASIGELAAGVGHEINNPLAIINGFLSLLKKEISPAFPKEHKVFELLKKIDVATLRIKNIVQGLRNFSRSEDVVNLDFPIKEAVTETVGLLKEIYQKENVELKVHLSAIDDVYIHGARGKIQQVLMNILANAKDATEGKEHRLIEISTDYKDDRVEIAITDNGRGISPGLRKRIFDPFFTTKEVNKGTGIGLALVATTMSEVHGEIDLVSEVGKFTTFRLFIPAFKAEAKAQTAPVASAPQLRGRVLVVDDETDLREILQELIQDMGFDVDTAGSGLEALERLQSAQYDGLVTDVQMPGLDGISLIKKVRLEFSSTVKKIFLITGGVNQDFEKGDHQVQSLIDGYFYKPFDMLKIKETFSTHFESLAKKQEAKLQSKVA